MLNRRSLLSRAGLAAGALAMGVSFGAGSAQAQESYLLTTASTGGTYYPVGVALATLVKVRLQNSNGIDMSAISSAGSGENIKLLREGEAHFAILQGLFGAYARTGTGPIASDGPQENLRSITMLWPNVEHFVIRSSFVDTGTISDMGALEGRAVSLGAQNSGTIGSNRTILGNLGIDIDTFYELVYAGYNPSADALQNGQIDAMSTPAGAPVTAVSRVFAAMGSDATLLSFTDEQMEKANGGLGLWTRYVVPAGTYPNQDKDFNTIAQPNFLAVSADVPEETVYLITKTIFENLDFLRNIHPATSEMSLQTALGGLPLPLHPGALRYFEEAGLTIPDALRP